MGKRNLLLLFFILGATFFFLPSAFCREQVEETGGKPTLPIPEALRSKLVRLLPTDSEITGLKGREDAMFYSPAELYKYIDGAADAFLAYDFQALGHREYTLDNTEITVDIYHMENPLNAYGIYSSERSPTSAFLAIGTEGYVSDFTLNFQQDRFYIKLSAFREKGQADQDLKKIAEVISQKIAGMRSYPQEFRLFPKEGLQPYSQTYILKSPLGHSFLGPAFLAKYDFKGKELRLLISVAVDAGSAHERLQRLQKTLKQPMTEPIGEKMGRPILGGQNPYEGYMLLFTHQSLVIVLITEEKTDVSDFLASLVKLLPIDR
jgi:hypothetical protein